MGNKEKRTDPVLFLVPVLVRTQAAAFWLSFSHSDTGTEPSLWRGDFKLDQQVSSLQCVDLLIFIILSCTSSPFLLAGHAVAEEEARKAHHLWLSVDALNYVFKNPNTDNPTVALESAAQAVKDNCDDDSFASALSQALPEESRNRGVYNESFLRAQFNALRPLARRVALIDVSHNSLYQYLLSYLQAALLFENKEAAPPRQLCSEDLDPINLLAYASYCLERGDLELAAKLVNQLRGEARRVLEDWLKEARLTLETRQVVGLLSAYANAVGLGTAQAP